MKPSTKRIILRVVHLVAVIPVFGYSHTLVDELAKGKKMEKILRKDAIKIASAKMPSQKK